MSSVRKRTNCFDRVRVGAVQGTVDDGRPWIDTFERPRVPNCFLVRLRVLRHIRRAGILVVGHDKVDVDTRSAACHQIEEQDTRVGAEKVSLRSRREDFHEGGKEDGRGKAVHPASD